MNRLLYVLSLVSSFLSLSCSDDYRIKGTSSLSHIDGKTITLMTSVDNEWRMVDSCEVLHGKFQMRGEADSNFIATLFIDGQPLMPIIIEPGRMEVLINNLTFKVAGTPLNDSLYQFIARKYRLDMRAMEVDRMESQMIMDGYPQSEIEAHLDSAYQTLGTAMEILVRNFIGSNFDNVLSLCGFSMLCNGLPYPTITPLMQSVIDEAPREFLEQPMISRFLQTARENMEKHGMADAVCGE